MDTDNNLKKAKERVGGERWEVGRGVGKGDSCNHVNIKNFLLINKKCKIKFSVVPPLKFWKEKKEVVQMTNETILNVIKH